MYALLWNAYASLLMDMYVSVYAEYVHKSAHKLFVEQRWWHQLPTQLLIAAALLIGCKVVLYFIFLCNSIQCVLSLLHLRLIALLWPINSIRHDTCALNIIGVANSILLIWRRVYRSGIAGVQEAHLISNEAPRSIYKGSDVALRYMCVCVYVYV